jgi:hypothetical protein
MEDIIHNILYTTQSNLHHHHHLTYSIKYAAP